MGNDIIKIKEGFVLREVAGSYVVVVVGEQVKNFKGIIKLNEVGAFLWSHLEKGASKEQLVEKLLGEYDIDSNTATSDVEDFVKYIKEAGLTK